MTASSRNPEVLRITNETHKVEDDFTLVWVIIYRGSRRDLQISNLHRLVSPCRLLPPRHVGSFRTTFPHSSRNRDDRRGGPFQLSSRDPSLTR